MLFTSLYSVDFEIKALKNSPAARPTKIARGYISGTVDFTGLAMPKSSSGHKRTLQAEFKQNQKCGGVKPWSICRGMPEQLAVKRQRCNNKTPFIGYPVRYGNKVPAQILATIFHKTRHQILK